MKYTPEELQRLSDFEINCLIDEILNLCALTLTDGDGEPFLEHPGTFVEIDYCQNPSDIIPIAFENELDLNCMGELDDNCVYWEVSSNHYKVENRSPLRAICEVFILMNQRIES